MKTSTGSGSSSPSPEFAHSLPMFLLALMLGASLVAAGPARAVLGVSIEARPDPVKPGETVDVVVHLANPGLTNVGSTSLSVTLPAFIEPFSESLLTGSSNCNLGASATLCEPGEVMLFVFGTIFPGQQASVSFPAIVSSGAGAPPNGTLLSFSAQGTGTGQVAVNAVGTVVVETAPVLDLAIADDRDPVLPGEELTYRLSYGNKAAIGSLANGVMSVAIPIGSTFVRASDGGLLNGANVVWPLGTLAAGESGERTFVVTVNAGLAGGSRLDTNATITAGVPAATARAVARTRVQIGSELQISIAPSLDPVAPGERQATSLLVTNRATVNAGSVVVTLRLPDWIAPFSEAELVGLANCDRGTSVVLCEPGEQILWALGTIFAGAGERLSLPPLIRSDGRAPVNGEIVSLHAIVNDSVNRYSTAQRNFAIAPRAPLALALEADLDLAEPGSDFVQHLRYGNRSDTDNSPSTVLEVVLPPGADFVSATGGGTLVGDRVEWSIGTLAIGESGDVSLTVGIEPGTENGQHLAFNGRLGNAASPMDETRAIAVSRVRDVSELQTTIELSPNPVAPGERFTATVTVSNRTGLNVGSVLIQLRLPDGIEPFSESVLTGLSNCDRGASGTLCEPGEWILWSFGTLFPGQERVGEFTTLVSQGGLAPAAGDLLRFESIASDSVSRSATVDSSLAVTVRNDLALSLAEDRDPVEAGARLDYRLDFGFRAASGSAPSPVLEMPLPMGASFVSATGGGVLIGDTVRWQPGTLAPGQSRSVWLTVELDVDLEPGTLVRAEAHFVDASSPPRRTRAEAATRVQSGAELQTSIELNPDPAAPGERFTATVTVSNPTTTNSGSVVVTLRLPEGIEPFSEALLTGLSNCDRGASATLCEPGEQILWAFGTLFPGQSRAGDLSTIVTAGGLGKASGDLLRFEASASDSGNRSSILRRSLPVDAAGHLTLSIDDDLDPIEPDTDLSYRISFGYTVLPGSSPANVLTMPIPRGTSFVSATNGGVLVGDSVVWNIGTLDLLTGEVGLTVHVDPLIPSGSLIKTTAQIVDGSNPIDRSRAEVSTTVLAGTGLRLAIEAQPQRVVPNQSLTLSLTVTNRTALNSGSNILTVRLPDYVQAFPETALVVANCDRGLSVTLCEPGEQALFALGTILAGQSIVRNLPVTVTDNRSLLPANELLRFVAIVTDSVNREAVATRTVPEPGIALGLLVGVMSLWGRVRRRRRRCIGSEASTS